MERDTSRGMTVFDPGPAGWRETEFYRSQRPHSWAPAVRSPGSRRRRVRRAMALAIVAIIGIGAGFWIAGMLAERIG